MIKLLHFNIVLLFFCIVCVPLQSSGFSIDTLIINSALVNRSLPSYIVLPDSYKKDSSTGQRYPVLYLLHCYGTDQNYYIRDVAHIDALIDDYRFIVVCPGDITNNSWWLDSPMPPYEKYSAYLVNELKPAIDRKYTTLTDGDNTAISGHSMGGFGALHNMRMHPGIFRIAISIKGAENTTLPLDASWYGNDFGLYQRLGNADSCRINWTNVNLLIHAADFKNTGRIRIYNGIQDILFYKENIRFHTTLDSLGIAHEYFEVPEIHQGVSQEMMKQIFTYCDSSFTRKGARIIRGPQSARITSGRRTNEKKVDFKGRKIVNPQTEIHLPQ